MVGTSGWNDLKDPVARSKSAPPVRGTSGPDASSFRRAFKSRR